MLAGVKKWISAILFFLLLWPIELGGTEQNISLLTRLNCVLGTEFFFYILITKLMLVL